MLNLIVLSVPLLLLHYVQSSYKIDPLVDTKVGLFRGLKATDGDYSMFLGIPYAEINKTNPFGPSAPSPKHGKIFEAFDDTARCPQLDSGTPVGTLDCLHLNVYVPDSASSANRLPVMVWIYGGSFRVGAAGRNLYGPKYLVRHDIILVTINYRLGPYGFMCLDIPEVPGNQGLKDQLLALRWIKDNIESFGGDVNKITLFGESAGARSGDFHLISSQEKLFNNVIMQSGTSLNRNTRFEVDMKAPLKITAQLGFPTDAISEALTFLSTVDSKLVIAASTEIGLTYGTCIEKDFYGIEKFIVDYPINLKIPKAKNISILIGNNNNEQLVPFATKDAKYFENLDFFNDIFKENFDFEEEKLVEMVEIVKKFYLGEKKINQEVMWELIDFDSDFTHNHPTQRSLDMYLESGAKNIFYYFFSYIGGRNYYKDINNVTVGGAAHADDLGYLFDMAMYGDPTPEDQLIIDRMTSMWTNFAKFSDPTPVLTELLPVKWQPMNKEVMYYLNITTDLSVGKRPFHDRMAFWDLFYKLNWKSQKGYREMVFKVNEITDFWTVK